MLQKVQIGFLTNTSSSLMLNRDDILSDIRRICGIETSIPLLCHDKRYYHHDGVPGAHYTLSPTGLVLFTDKSTIDDAKELIYGNLLKSLWNRRFLPRSTSIVPCSPDDTVPPPIHERIMKAHINTINTLQQCTVEGLTWKQANTAVTLRVGSKFQTHSKLLGIVPLVFLRTASHRTQSGQPLSRTHHSESRTPQGKIILNYKPEDEDHVRYNISLTKALMKDSLLTDEYHSIFHDDSPSNSSEQTPELPKPPKPEQQQPPKHTHNSSEPQHSTQKTSPSHNSHNLPPEENNDQTLPTPSNTHSHPTHTTTHNNNNLQPPRKNNSNTSSNKPLETTKPPSPTQSS
jgi:hypothetical protein